MDRQKDGTEIIGPSKEFRGLMKIPVISNFRIETHKLINKCFLLVKGWLVLHIQNYQYSKVPCNEKKE